MNIHFENASFTHKDAIFSWLAEPHFIEFWDNSQAHKDDIINFMEGRKTPSTYFGGIFSYWLGFLDNIPYALIMTHEESMELDSPENFIPFLSKSGKTFSLDFGIGNKDFVGKKLAAPTLVAFTEYFSTAVEPDTDIFIIDPALNNPRAIHVYQKAGFEIKSKFTQEGGYFDGNKGVVMVKKL